MDKIGDRKLNILFSKEEVNKMRAVSRVADYIQVQPSGSAVNNSKTAAAMVTSMFDFLGKATPFINEAYVPIRTGIGTSVAQKMPAVLRSKSVNAFQKPQLVAPAAMLVQPSESQHNAQRN